MVGERDVRASESKTRAEREHQMPRRLVAHRAAEPNSLTPKPLSPIEKTLGSTDMLHSLG